MVKLVDTTDLSSVGDSRVGSTPTAPTKQEILALYEDFIDVYGPYIRKDGRKIVILYDGVNKSARQYAKVVLEVKLGRRLIGDETADHIDGDKTNDAPDNLRVLSRRENAQASAKRIRIFAACATCGEKFELSAAQRNTRSKKRKLGPFCSSNCKSQGFRNKALELSRALNNTGENKCPK